MIDHTADARPETTPRFALIERLESLATRIDTPCDNGTMRWREWGQGPALVLLHGGFGSWMHWIHNIDALSEHFRVVVADLPGLGESDVPTREGSPQAIGAIVTDGVRAILNDERFDLAGFSFGGLIGGQVAGALGEQVRTFTLVGASGMKLTRPPMELIRRRDDMTAAELEAAYVHNAMSLMLHDPASLDALALHIHKTNDAHARLRSRRMSMGDSLLLALPHISARIAGIWGEFDATSLGYMDERIELLRSVQAHAPFTVIDNAGHWVQFEQSAAFNTALMGTIEQLRGQDSAN